MKLRDIMTDDIVTIQPQSTVMDAAIVMQAHNVGSVPVCTQEGQLVGIVTDRDIVVRNVANNGDPNTTKVEEVMTKQVITGNPDMDVNQAIQLMAQHKIRRLPVMESNKLIGLVALGDLATNFAANDQAGEALSQISSPSRPMNLH
ncbi:MAG: CBS domain-containing protein [Clostridia bacterium]|jgi:CBS domain-containing protein